jgi:hypothetical protein
MSAEIITLARAKRQRQKAKTSKRRRQSTPFAALPVDLPWEARQAVRMIRRLDDEEDMTDDRSRQRVRFLMTDAADRLERGLAAYSDTQRRELRRVVVDALRPDALVGELNGARAMLELILNALPPRRE